MGQVDKFIVTTSEERELYCDGVTYSDYKWHVEVKVHMPHMKANKPEIVLVSEDFVERFTSVHSMYTFVRDNFTENEDTVD